LAACMDHSKTSRWIEVSRNMRVVRLYMCSPVH
jgi:hypothetical protein